MKTAINYDLSGLESYLQVFPPEAICDRLAGIMFDYAASVNAEALDRFHEQAAWLATFYAEIGNIKTIEEEGGCND